MIKKLNRRKSVFVPLLALAFASNGYAQSNLVLLQKENLVYQGAFKLPAGSSDQTTFNYGGTAITYNPENNSLFVTGHDHHQRTAEVTIPAAINSSNTGNLQTASILQSFSDPVNGRIGDINPSDPNSKKIGGHLVYQGNLYVTAYSFYDGQGTQSRSHFVRPLSLSNSGVQGPYRVGSDPHFVSGYMATVPPEWQSQIGGPALTGNCCLSITSVQSNGPAVSVFDPADIGSGGNVAATPLVGYPYPNILGPGETTRNDLFNLATKISGVVFPNGTRSVLFFGRQGKGNYCYGEGSECNDPADPYKGTHSYPYEYQVWAYDANDLVDVKNGRKSRSSVEPYVVWNFDLPNDTGGKLLGGAAYDASTGRIYISNLCAYGECAPTIEVFEVDGAVQVTVPNAPDNLRAQ